MQDLTAMELAAKTLEGLWTTFSLPSHDGQLVVLKIFRPTTTPLWVVEEAFVLHLQFPLQQLPQPQPRPQQQLLPQPQLQPQQQQLLQLLPPSPLKQLLLILEVLSLLHLQQLNNLQVLLVQQPR